MVLKINYICDKYQCYHHKMVFHQLFTILFIASAIVNLVEGVPFFQCIYFMVVTMSTVGYGDISPKKDIGRLMVSLIIICSWVLVPDPGHPYPVSRWLHSLHILGDQVLDGAMIFYAFTLRPPP